MNKNSAVLIKNIYYMLAYAFSALKQRHYEFIAAENFENIYDLLAEILSIGINSQIKRGVHKEYQNFSEDTNFPHGHINISRTIQNKSRNLLKLNCGYDNLTEDNIFNQIIKLTTLELLKNKNVKEERKIKLRRIQKFFVNVQKINYQKIKWHDLRYDRSNQTYQALINICYFILKSLILSEKSGDKKVQSFTEDSLRALYEKFVLNYYIKNYPQLRANPDEIDWFLTDAKNDAKNFLPRMRTDITLRYRGKILIIDTKFYSKTMQERFEKQSYISQNLYQIFTYVKNLDKSQSGGVAGALLYAKTTEEITPDDDFEVAGNKIFLKTLDLNTDFKNIEASLRALAENFLFAEKI